MVGARIHCQAPCHVNLSCQLDYTVNTVHTLSVLSRVYHIYTYQPTYSLQASPTLFICDVYRLWRSALWCCFSGQRSGLVISPPKSLAHAYTMTVAELTLHL